MKRRVRIDPFKYGVFDMCVECGWTIPVYLNVMAQIDPGAA